MQTCDTPLPGYQPHAETTATQETRADDTTELACSRPDRASLNLVLLSLSPNSLDAAVGCPIPIQGLQSEEGSGNNDAIQFTNDIDENITISPLSTSPDNSNPEQPETNDSARSSDSSDEELHKPVEATQLPTGGTSVLVPSSSPPRSRNYHTDIAKLLKSYDNISLPNVNDQAHFDPADQHRNPVCARTEEVNIQQSTSAAHNIMQQQNPSGPNAAEITVETVEGNS